MKTLTLQPSRVQPKKIRPGFNLELTRISWQSPEKTETLLRFFSGDLSEKFREKKTFSRNYFENEKEKKFELEKG